MLNMSSKLFHTNKNYVKYNCQLLIHFRWSLYYIFFLSFSDFKYLSRQHMNAIQFLTILSVILTQFSDFSSIRRIVLKLYIYILDFFIQINELTPENCILQGLWKNGWHHLSTNIIGGPYQRRQGVFWLRKYC